MNDVGNMGSGLSRCGATPLLKPFQTLVRLYMIKVLWHYLFDQLVHDLICAPADDNYGPPS